MRRSPDPEQRQRDPERSKQQLLDAAIAEFSAHGFRGARVSAIAARAGVNKQLISYYFGGKEGLYRAVADRWQAGEPAVTAPERPLAELVGAYAVAALEQPELLRLLVREGLEHDAGTPDQQEQFARFHVMLDDFRRRKVDGELAADLDPRYAALALFGLAAAPAVFPQIARALDLDVGNADFATEYAHQATTLVAHLAQG
ncbi:TetR/AcrR family transcriptional regulator [Nocardia sp. NPDC059195]|uniref:TetR/AcrR family transcriptional regulator n=1 Tax=Nocardia sp. NPDC059195 TaxID=3346765 RepID=UPI0036931715